MKKTNFTLVFVLLVSTTIFAGSYSSIQDGKWYWPTTWSISGTTAPIDGDAVSISHLVTEAGTCSSLTIGGSGKLYSNVTVNGDLSNSGELRDDPNHGSDYIWLSLSGNFTNNGVTGISDTYLTGSGGQVISHNHSSRLSLGTTRITDSTNTVTIVNNIDFEGTSFLCQGAQLIITESVDYLNFESGSIDGIIEANGCTLHLDSGIYGSLSSIGWTGAGTFGPSFTQLRNATIESDKYIHMEPTGTGDWGVELYNCTNNTTLGGNGTFYTDSNFVNNGAINGYYTDVYHTSNMYIIAKGDFIHNGSFNRDIILYAQQDVSCSIGAVWEDIAIYMDGEIDQEITFYEDVLPYSFRINANVSDATTYQWYLDGQLIAGQTAEVLDLKRDTPQSVANVDGVYHCVTDQGNSRNVTVTSGNDFDPPADPIDVSGVVASDNKSVTITWSPNTEVDFLNYNVIRNDSLLKVTTDTFYVDTTYSGASSRYYISAIDTAGNESAKITSNIAYPQVHSTASGGNWDDVTTWMGEIKPQSTDSVIINGPVWTNGNPTVSHMFVTDSGSFSKDWSINRLKISGNLYVDGTIENCNGDGIEIGGHLFINGSIDCQNTKFTGTNDHYFSMHDTATIHGNIEALESRIIAKSDLHIGVIGESTSRFDVKELELTEGYNLYNQATRIGEYSRTLIIGNGNSVYSNDNNPVNQYFFKYADLQDVKLHGNTYFYYGVRMFGEVSNEDSLLLSVSANGYYVDVQGNFTNNSYMYTDLKFKFHNNLINNHYFRCGEVIFVGDNDHQISCLNGNQINTYNGFYCDSNKVVAMTDLYLYSTYGGYNIIETECNGYDLYLDHMGIGANTALRPAIKANGRSITMNASGYYGDCDIYNARIKGVSRIYDYARFYDETIIEDTLASYTTSAKSAAFYGDLINNGHLGRTNAYYNINLILHKSYENNGIADLNKVTFVGDSTHYLSGTDEIYSYSGFLSDSNEVLIASDVTLRGGNYNMVKTVLSNNATLDWNGTMGNSSWGKRALIDGANGQLKMSGGYYENVDLHDVTLLGYNRATSACDFYGDVTIQDTLVSYSSSVRRFDFYGDLINNGHLGRISTSSDAAPDVYIYQNLTNNGSTYINKLNFVGDSIHKLTTSSEMYSYYGFFCDSSKILAMSDLYFKSINNKYNVVETDLSNGFDLYLSDIRVGYYTWDKRAVIKAANNAVKMTGTSSYFNKCDIYDATLKGVNIFTSDAGLYGNVILQDTLTGYNSSNRSVNIYGNLTNNGMISNHTGFYTPQLNIYHSFVNNGTCNTYDVSFIGDSIHEVSTLNENVINSYYGFSCDSSKVLAMSDLYFTSSNEKYNVVETDLSNGFDLYLSNIIVGYYTWDKRSTIKADGNSIKMMGTSSYYNKCDIYNAILRGVNTTTSDMGLYGDIIIQDTLTGYNNTNRDVNIYGNMINNGFISNVSGRYTPTLNIYQSFVNNGTCNTNDVKFIGDSIHDVSTLNENVMHSYLGFTCDSSKILAMSDLYFSSSNNKYNVVETDLSNGYDLYLTNTDVGYYTWDKRAIITAAGNDVKMMGNSGYYNKCDIYNANLRGISIASSDAKMYGDIILQDTLVAYSNSNGTPSIYGNFTNKGYIGGIPSFYKPLLNLYGDISNQGIWNSGVVKVMGTEDQMIYLDSVITAQVEFVSDIGDSTFQWKMDDVDILSATANPYVFASLLSLDDVGVYNCATDEGTSRDITVGAPVITHNIELSDASTLWRLYPNPAHSFIHISNVNMEASYKVTSLSGTVMLQGQVDDGNIAVGGLSDGLYIVQIEQGNKRVVERLMIRK